MGKMIDLTNQTFGELTALYPLKERKNRQIVWHCRCRCGNECDVVSQALRTLHTQSCGCLQKRKASEKNQHNLINQTFGHLTVKKDSGLRKERAILWLCECDCGNITYVKGSDLISGKVKTCGYNCPLIIRGKDLTNQRFGHLIAKEKTDKRTKAGRIIWLCQCDCGNVCEVPASSLISLNTTSCGCIKSKGEKLISELLTTANIIFETEKTFDDCIYEGYLLRFDFYIPDKNYLIEFDGIQHYKGWSNSPLSLENIQRHDNIKNQWCKEHNVSLIRIPYTHYDKLQLNDLLLETSSFIL